jgi:hypothetical protein
MPSRCAPGSGILYKAVLSQNAVNPVAGATGTEVLPLLDCAANMKVVFALDTDGDGVSDTPTDDLSTMTAEDIRNQLREIRVYIVAHEGQIDRTYTYTNSNPVPGCTAANQICINDVGVPPFGLIDAFTLPSLNYRWKIYTIIVTPYNLR